MIAKILNLNPKSQEVFGFAPDPTLDSGADLTVYGALQKTCEPETGCSVAGGQLIELAVFNKEKQAAIGFDLAKSGVWLGIRITDDRVWKAIEDGEIDQFSIAVDGGVTVEFPEVIGKSKKGDVFMETVCKCGAQQAQHSDVETVVKRAAAGEINREEVWMFAQELAVKAKQPNETIEKALDRVMQEHGLDRAYDSAALAAPALVEKRAEVVINDAEKKLHDLALQEMAAAKNENYPAAYRRAMSLYPALAQAAVDGLPLPAEYTA